MIFRQLFDRDSCTYTYLLASAQGREAILIDPVCEFTDAYIKLINELELKLVIALDTHTHADHITATGPLSKQTACRIAMGVQSKAEHVSQKIKEGDIINVDGIKLEAIYTPGHTDDSYSLKMDDRVFTGDTLLIRRTGRTDFQNGDPLKQYDSLFNKLLRLPDDTLVYPAHDYCGCKVSSIGEEKKHNPRLQVSSPEEYADLMNHLDLPPPRRIDEALPANRCCGLI